MPRDTAKALPDRPYPQKHAAITRLPGGRHPNDVRALAAAGDAVWCATAHGLFRVEQSFAPPVSPAELPPEWTPGVSCERVEIPLPTGDIKDVRGDDAGRLWIATLDGVARRDAGGWRTLWTDTLAQGVGAVMSVAPDAEGDGFWAVTSHGGTGRYQGGCFSPLDADVVGRARTVETGPDGVWFAGDDGVALLDRDGRVIARGLAGLAVRRARRAGSVMLFATSDGIRLYRGGHFATLDVKAPNGSLFDVLAAGDGSVWAASVAGAWRHQPDGALGPGRMHVYHGLRYLPSPHCRALAETASGSVWVATNAGLAHLAELPHRLEEKCGRFEQRIAARHDRLGGFVTSAHLHRPGDLTAAEAWPSDNDGLWTGLYLAAESYRYAATKDPEALARAKRAFAAMERLEAVTTIPGFPTKAIVKPGHPDAQHGSVPWHPSADGEWLWKGDCSSDEIDGHLYAYSIYFDLAADAAERARIVTLVDKIMTHILDNGYFIIGLDGQPTRWGVWAPAKLNDDPAWRPEQGLNSMEILSHLRAAHHITGKQRYLDAYRELIEEHHYDQNMLRQKIDHPGHDNHSDDELAFISYYPLLKYEDDPALRSLYLDSLEHAWRIERPERNPLWNLIYNVLADNRLDLAETVQTLREIPLDLIDWNVDNSIRQDVAFKAISGRFGELETEAVLPYDELPISKWNGNPYRAAGGGGGHAEDDGAYFLLPYWMGRYYGLITAG
ncbi:MAG TPA: hypothetical protein VFK80_12275 [Limnochordia bacterium]|nr:hypothetical protein [Limnochordia bacterium]